MDCIQNLNSPEVDTDSIILYSKDLNIKYEYSITKHYAVNTFLNRQLFKNPSFLDDLHQQILKTSKNNISFPQDVVDLMQRYTENPDDISPAEFKIISNHLDATIDMEGDTGDLPLHTHLVCIYLLKF